MLCTNVKNLSYIQKKEKDDNMLTKIAYSTTIIATLSGAMYDMVHTMYLREDYGPIRSLDGALALLFFVLFWYIVSLITPKKWWGADIK